MLLSPPIRNGHNSHIGHHSRNGRTRTEVCRWRTALQSASRYSQPTRLKRQYIAPQVAAIRPSAAG